MNVMRIMPVNNTRPTFKGTVAKATDVIGELENKMFKDLTMEDFYELLKRAVKENPDCEKIISGDFKITEADKIKKIYEEDIFDKDGKVKIEKFLTSWVRKADYKEFIKKPYEELTSDTPISSFYKMLKNHFTFILAGYVSN